MASAFLLQQKIAAVILSMVIPLCLPQMLSAAELLNGRLELSGHVRQFLLIRAHIPRTQRSLHDTPVGVCLTSARLESLYRLHSTGTLSIKSFAALDCRYDSALSFDDQLNRSVPHRARKGYRMSRDDELLNEAYLDIAGRNWQLLLGKQIVVWGETDIVRTADVVNPLDLRYSLPGLDAWEDIKMGLWMIRALYRSRLPGRLLFEAVLIPGDFQPQLLPREGTHWGPSPADTSPLPGRCPGFGHWVLEKMLRDAPGRSFSDTAEWGVRIRGYTADIDWTLFYFDTLSDTATAIPYRTGLFATAYVKNVLGCLMAGDKSSLTFPGRRVYRYKRYRIIGGTAQLLIPRLRNSVWRLEWFYEIGRHYNRTVSGMITGLGFDDKERDSLGAAVSYNDRFHLPGITHRLFSDKKVEVSLTLYYEKIRDYDRRLAVDPSRGHRIGSSHSCMIVWNLIQPAYHQIWLLVFSGYYNTSGQYFLMPLISYAPGNHWRWEFGAAVFGHSSSRAQHPYHDRDSIICRVRFEW